MNPHIGHLYHDGSISNAYTVLDAKEKMKTREINAREAKSFSKYSGVLDRAKRVCKRQNEWEQQKVRKHLDNIKFKTPSLAQSLKHESERIKLQSMHGVRKINTDEVGSGFGEKCAISGKGPRKRMKLSPWSIYSHLDGELRAGKADEKCKTAPSSLYRSSRLKDNSDLTKTDKLVKRADQVTKSLHGLYTKTFERKWKEKGMTVLDILTRNSREELEKALFVLRGTPTGDAIEDILRDQELLSKSPSEKVSSAEDLDESDHIDKLSDEVFVTELGETVLRQSIKNKARSSSQSSLENSFNSSPQNSVSLSKNVTDNSSSQYPSTLTVKTNNQEFRNNSNIWGEYENPLTINQVFERDNSFMLSSMLANPSETDDTPASHRWRDIFKAPELWKKRSEVTKYKDKTKPVSIVTLTGKYRQTMLK